jgi:hypothetical protein
MEHDRFRKVMDWFMIELIKSPPRLPKYQSLGARHQPERLYGGQVTPLCQRGE